MKRLLTLWMLALLPYCISAQTDAKAAEVLDKVLENISETNGIRIDYGGTENGFLLLKGEKFYLNNGSIQSWYDGKTQWSYVADTDEVNISHPTPEELQGINPYFILVYYQENFESSYKGMKTHEGKQVQEIVLAPKGNANEQITLWISKTSHPIYIKVENNGRPVSEIHVKNVRKQKEINDHVFRFNKSLYPNAEIIDLR